MLSRKLAIEVLEQVITEHQPLDAMLLNLLGKSKLNNKDTAFVKALCYGALRQYHYLNAILNSMLKTTIAEEHFDIRIIIIIGLYQIMFMRVPEHAAINSSVELGGQTKKTWSKALINAVLRNFTRNKNELLEKLPKDAKFSHPSWLTKKIKTAWPDHWQTILTANNQNPPMHLRVNNAKISNKEYLQLLKENNISAKSHNNIHSAITLDNPVDVKLLPGFKKGLVSVQDLAAQQVVDLLQLKPEQKILDACAAPGGKTCHLLEKYPDIKLTAVDSGKNRLGLVKENLLRLNLQAQLICADASHTNWWDGKLFDAVLLDAPCSATGVIRRHPDIKLLRNHNQVLSISTKQSVLLENLWQMVKPNGSLLYVTCSILSVENDEVIEKFMHGHKDAKLSKINLENAIKTKYGWQLLPTNMFADGFYFSKLSKV